MAFSMLLRSPVCTNKGFLQQVMKVGSRQLLSQRAISSTLPIKIVALQGAKSTPILNAVRSFRTSGVQLSAEKPHDHSKLWVVEKAVAAVMIPLIPVALLLPNKLFDAVLAILISAHTFWGLQAMVVEYIRVILFGEMVPKAAMMGVYFISVTILGGLLYLVFNDIGLCRGFWRIWRNMKNKDKKKK